MPWNKKLFQWVSIPPLPVYEAGALPLSYGIVLDVWSGNKPLESKFDFPEFMNFISQRFGEKLYCARFNQDSGREIQETVRWPSG